MIASSSTVLSNLAYLIGAVVLAVAGGLIVWLHHRKPRSVDANVASFRKGLNALAPDPGAGLPHVADPPAPLSRPVVKPIEPPRRAQTGSPVRALGSARPRPAGDGPAGSPAVRTADDRVGGQPG